MCCRAKGIADKHNLMAAHLARGRDNSMNCIRTDDEIARVENWAVVASNGETNYPGMNYEQGVIDTILWLRGDIENAPDE